MTKFESKLLEAKLFNCAERFDREFAALAAILKTLPDAELSGRLTEIQDLRRPLINFFEKTINDLDRGDS